MNFTVKKLRFYKKNTAFEFSPAGLPIHNASGSIENWGRPKIIMNGYDRVPDGGIQSPIIEESKIAFGLSIEESYELIRHYKSGSTEALKFTHQNADQNVTKSLSAVWYQNKNGNLQYYINLHQSDKKISFTITPEEITILQQLTNNLLEKSTFINIGI